MSGIILRLFAGGTHMHRTEKSPRNAPLEPETADAGDVHPSPGAPFIVADPHQVAERSDGAGSELVDD
jgi:hypothetical protein